MEQQEISVVDTQHPVLAGVPADVEVECDAVPAPAAVTATDTCDPAPSLEFVGPIFMWALSPMRGERIRQRLLGK